MKRIPKQWILTTLYMVLIYCVGIAVVHYVKTHPIVDERPQEVAAP